MNHPTPTPPNPSRRRAAMILVTLVASFGLFACNLLSRASDMAQTVATTEAGKLINTLEAPGDATQPGAQSAQSGATQAPLLLDGPLPRSFRYAGLEFTLQKAAITSEPPEGANYDDQRGAYAQTVWKVTNPNTTYTNVSGGVFTLTLNSGEYKRGFDESFNSQDSRDINIVFSVDAGSTWDNATLTFTQAGKVPAQLPLNGAVVPVTGPAKLAATGEAKLTETPLEFVVQDASLDLDGVATRANEGSRYLLLKVAATCRNRYDCYVGPESFRVIVNGTPSAAEVLDPVAAAVSPDTSQTFLVVFQVPDSATQVDLQVGESGKETAKIPLDLSTAP